jgi:hypothetical protein
MSSASQDDNDSVALSAVAATPEVVAAQLTAVNDLQLAAQQVADELGVAPEQVRVRIQLQSCITCNLEENAAATSQEGLSVAEAVEQIEPNATLWLFVQNFTCTYTFDGERFAPQTCQFAPL